MKRLNTNNTGRMPMWQKDLDFIQEAFTEPIMAILQELKIDNRYMMPVTGCKVTVDANARTVSMSAGWFWWDGELLPVHALASTPWPEGVEVAHAVGVHLTRVTNPIAEGARNFIHADLTIETVADVWQDDYAEPEACTYTSSYPSGVTLRPDARTLFDDIKLRLTDSESGWNTIYGADPIGVSFKRIGRMVVLRGTVFSQTDSTPITLGLPVPLGGYAALHHAVSASDLSLHVTGDGGLVVEAHPEGGVPLMVSLTGMMYMAEEPYISVPTDMNVIISE